MDETFRRFFSKQGQSWNCYSLCYGLGMRRWPLPLLTNFDVFYGYPFWPSFKNYFATCGVFADDFLNVYTTRTSSFHRYFYTYKTGRPRCGHRGYNIIELYLHIITLYQQYFLKRLSLELWVCIYNFRFRVKRAVNFMCESTFSNRKQYKSFIFSLLRSEIATARYFMSYMPVYHLYSWVPYTV